MQTMYVSAFPKENQILLNTPHQVTITNMGFVPITYTYDVPVNDSSAITLQPGQTSDDSRNCTALHLLSNKGNQPVRVELLSPSSGGGTGVLTYTDLAALQAALPNGSAAPVWVTADNAWYYWNGAVTVTIPSIPAAPTATSGDNQVSLSWTAVSGATSYKVYRGGTLIASPTTNSYSDTSAVNGTAYSYTVSAVNSAGESAQSTSASATPSAPSTAPATPSTPTATAGNNQVALSWNAASGATSYKVYRGGTLLASPTTNSYTDATAVNGTTYSYTVSAVNNVGESAQSSAASATPVAPSGQTVGANLFNPANRTTGNYINGSNGAVTALAGWNASDFIALELGEIYTITGATGGANKAYYNSSQAYAKEAVGVGLNGADFIGLASLKYIRFSIADANVNTLTFVKVGKQNLYNSTTNVAGTALSGTSAAPSANASYQTTDYIPVAGGSTYVLPGNGFFGHRSEYDSSHIFIRNVNDLTAEQTVAANATYVRISVSNTNAPDGYFYLK